jgi:hypothetical protein
MPKSVAKKVGASFTTKKDCGSNLFARRSQLTFLGQEGEIQCRYDRILQNRESTSVGTLKI